MKTNRQLRCALCSAALGFASARLAAADSQITVYPQLPLQQIDGFGASDAWYAGAIHSFGLPQQTQILDDLFSPTSGAGLSLLRHRVPPEIEPSSGVWDWSQDTDALWLSQQAITRGVSQVWSTVWSPPAWMKTNNNVNYGGAVATAHYQDYATYLSTYIQHYASSAGIKLSGISIANEPDQTVSYESSNWSSQQFHDFIAGNLMPTFQKAKIQTQIILPELSYWSDDRAAATLADPVTASFVSIVASHDYGGTPSPFTDATNLYKRVWETEVSNLGADDPSINDGLSWALTIHHTLVDAHANAWHYWWLYADISDTTGQSLISGSPTSNSFVTKKRLWTIGNFSRFVRPGSRMVKVSANNPESGVYVTAYTSALGAISIVAINTNTTSKNLTANVFVPSITQALEYRTSATENLSFVSTVAMAHGILSAALAPQSVTTFSLQGPKYPVP